MHATREAVDEEVFDFADPVDSFGGPKTRRFYLNISGDTEAVTVDVWALRVVGRDDSTIGRKTTRSMKRASCGRRSCDLYRRRPRRRPEPDVE